jgi:hypothetical protein
MAIFKPLTVVLWLLIVMPCISQQQMLSVALTARLDSVRMGNGNERHFGELYLRTTILVEEYIETLPDQGKQLIRKLEERFASYFFNAIDANNSGDKIPEVWKNYFSGNYSPLQLKLMGANAHINGDIWKALSDNFSLEEIKQVKPFYKKYNRSITKAFDELFIKAIRSDKRLHDLHIITLGLDKVYGRIMLKKWRKRQLKLAILKFENPERFNSLKKTVDKKRNRIDKMIICRLNVNE